MAIDLNSLDFTSSAYSPSQSTVVVCGNLDAPGAFPNQTVNEYSAMSITAFNRGVRFITSRLARLMATANVYRKDGDKRLKVDHSVSAILSRKPNINQTSIECFETFFHHAIVWGNGYLLKQRDDSGEVIGLLNISPERVYPFLDSEGVKYYYVEVTKEQAKQYPSVELFQLNKRSKGFFLTNDDCIHLALIGFDGLKGYPPVKLMRDTLSTAKNISKHTSEYFRKGGNIRGYLTMPGTLTPAQVDTLRSGLDEYKRGGVKEYQYMILQGGAEIKNLTLDNETSQLFENRQFTTVEIAQILGVSPIFLFAAAANPTTAEQMSSLALDDLAEYVAKIEQQFSRKLLSDTEQESGLYVRVNTDALMRMDATARQAMLRADHAGGLRTTNELRALMELPPVEGGDVLLVPVAVAQPKGQTPSAGGNASPPEATAEAAPVTAPQPLKNAADSSGERLAAVLSPILESLSARVETKTSKAFENKGNKADESWRAEFATAQAQMVVNEFSAVARSAEVLSGKAVDVSVIAQAYSAEILSGEPKQGKLLQLAKEYIYGK